MKYAIINNARTKEAKHAKNSKTQHFLIKTKKYGVTHKGAAFINPKKNKLRNYRYNTRTPTRRNTRVHRQMQTNTRNCKKCKNAKKYKKQKNKNKRKQNKEPKAKVYFCKKASSTPLPSPLAEDKIVERGFRREQMLCL